MPAIEPQFPAPNVFAPKTVAQYADALAIALEIAVQAHKGQRDERGSPVILRRLAVAARLPELRQKTVALLQYVVQDGAVTADMLVVSDIPPECVHAALALTRKAGESDDEQLARIAAAGELACVVKLADLVEHAHDHPHAAEAPFRARYAESIARMQAQLPARLVAVVR